MSGRDDALRAAETLAWDALIDRCGVPADATAPKITRSDMREVVAVLAAALAPTPDAAPASEAREDGLCIPLHKSIPRDPFRVASHLEFMEAGIVQIVGVSEAISQVVRVLRGAGQGYNHPAPKSVAETGSTGADDGRKDALHEAVAAIYLADSSDYLGALWSVVRHLDPDLIPVLESSPVTAYGMTLHESDGAASPAQDAAHGGRHG